MPVGNDIVAWRHERCVGKAANQRFLNKVCSSAEQELIHNAADSDLLLWLQWSLKEAAYKFSCFTGNREKFHPLRFITHLPPHEPTNFTPGPNPFDEKPQLATGISGMPGIISQIEWAGNQYQGCSLLCNEYIHSLVAGTAAGLHSTRWCIAKAAHAGKNDYSEAVRNFTRNRLNTSPEPGQQVVEFSKDADGIPFMILQNGGQQYISLSHDQQWLSFASEG